MYSTPIVMQRKRTSRVPLCKFTFTAIMSPKCLLSPLTPTTINRPHSSCLIFIETADLLTQCAMPVTNNSQHFPSEPAHLMCVAQYLAQKPSQIIDILHGHRF